MVHTSECFCSISPSNTLSIRKQKSSQYRTSDSKITGNSESLKVFFCKVHIGPVCKTLHTSQCLEHLITGELSIFRTQLGPLRDLAPVSVAALAKHDSSRNSELCIPSYIHMDPKEPLPYLTPNRQGMPTTQDEPGLSRINIKVTLTFHLEIKRKLHIIYNMCVCCPRLFWELFSVAYQRHIIR